MRAIRLPFVAVFILLLGAGPSAVLHSPGLPGQAVSAFRTTFFLPLNAPVEVVAALQRFETHDYYQGQLAPFGDVIVVGNPWSPERPGLLLQHRDGVIERIYWAETASETRAWDPGRGLRTVAPCPGGCLSTEICLGS